MFLTLKQRLVIGTLFSLVLPATSPTRGADNPKGGAEAHVDAALQAEAIGDNVTRERSLRQALEAAPDDSPARWHAGEVNVDGKWLTVPEVVDRTLSSKTYAEYIERRKRTSSNLIGQAALARWCERNDLPGPARAHWIVVLRNDPTHRAALRALGLANIKGQFVSASEAESYEADGERLTEEYEQLVERLEKLRRHVFGESAAESRHAVSEIARVTDPREVSALLEVFADPPEEVDEERIKEVHSLLIDALMVVGQPWAMDRLVEQVIAGPDERAVDESLQERIRKWLGTQPIADVLPLLLARLKMPMEMGVSVTTAAGGKVVSSYDEYREGPAGNDYESSYDDYRYVPDHKYRIAPVISTRKVRDGYTVPGYITPERRIYSPCSGALIGRIPERYIPSRHVPAIYRHTYHGYVTSGEETPEYRYRERYAMYEARQKANYAFASMSMSNEQSDARNERVVKVLQELTDQDMPAAPRKWWNWWQENYDRHADRRQADQLSVPLGLVRQEPAGLSGKTKVWTRTGLRPIEQIEVGDEVLSQDPASGGLGFKPVLSVSSASDLPMREIRLDSHALVIAGGQWVWSTGEGWRLAKDMHDGDSSSATLLHGHHGSERVTQQMAADAQDAYALEVDEYATFFGGEPSLLLHDATHPMPTDSQIPGWQAR